MHTNFVTSQQRLHSLPEPPGLQIRKWNARSWFGALKSSAAEYHGGLVAGVKRSLEAKDEKERVAKHESKRYSIVENRTRASRQSPRAHATHIGKDGILHSELRACALGPPARSGCPGHSMWHARKSCGGAACEAWRATTAPRWMYCCGRACGFGIFASLGKA